ncbi:MAG: DUF1345 domain-containing protein [Methylovirgula sp.]|nr:DUF1345 domain-containing protein [Methylovirgula sp.]
MHAPTTRRRITWPVRVVRARPRLFISLAFGVLVGFLLPSDWRVITRILIGWNSGIFFYFVAVAGMVISADRDSMARRAVEQDDGRLTILFLTVVAATAAFGAIFYQLLMVKDVHGLQRAFHLLLAATTVISAWAFIHVMFALHYASECFSERELKTSPAAKAHGGLRFPGDETPDYFDFFYFSFVIGVACATADVNITSRMIRRTATIHCIVAFFFNSAVLALTVNIAAGLV